MGTLLGLLVGSAPECQEACLLCGPPPWYGMKRMNRMGQGNEEDSGSMVEVIAG
jgi:hypothetical protein